MPSPSRAKKTAGKHRAPTKRPQKHGGALLSGGKPGNKGGTGRPPESLRIQSREVFALWLDWAKQEMESDRLDTAARNVIGNTAAKYGLGTTITPTDTNGKTLTPGVLVVPAGVTDAGAWEREVAARQAALAARAPATIT